MKTQSLCILRLSAIGDVCHAVAMVQRIQASTPDIAITWIIGNVEYQLVHDLPGVEFIVFDKKQGRQAIKTLREQLNGRRFDTLFLMQVALRANLVSLNINAKQRVGFDWARSKELHWLFANTRIASQRHAHVLDGFMGFADAIGVPAAAAPSWQIPIPDEAQTWYAQHQAFEQPFVVINPAASKAERAWLPVRYAEVADYLQSKGYRVVLTGGPGALDSTLADAIQQAVTAPCIDMVGKTTLKQMLALLQGAQLVISPDSGPAHMATTVSTPVIGLYAHSNPRRTGPYNNLNEVVSVYDDAIQAQQGKSWESLPWGIRAKGAELMSGISVAAVKAKIDTVLG